jgi:hypothetical protein
LGQKSLYLFILPSTNKSLHETDRPRVNLWNLNCAIRLPFFHLCRLRSLSVVKLLIGELKEMTAGDEQYDAKYTVLSENVRYHIQEEESGLFPKLEGKLDAEELGAQMETRKQELQRQLHKPARGAKSKNSHSKAEGTTNGCKEGAKKSNRGATIDSCAS